MKRTIVAGLVLLAAAAARVGAQEPPPSSGEQTAIPFRPLEGSVIINLPSLEVPREGTLTLLFTHRFRQAVEGTTIHDLFSFDNGADIGIGLAYAPIRNLDVSFYRSSANRLDPWEFAAKYRVYSNGLFGAALRVGGNIRSETGLHDRGSFFTQAVLAVTIGSRARVTVVPTYVTKIGGAPNAYPADQAPPHDRTCTPLSAEPGSAVLCSSVYRHVFNAPAALSIAVTRSITVHGEVIPRYGKADSGGVGWSASIEKTLLRHRFCFTAGNQQATTVDQYAASLPYLTRFLPHGNHAVYLGFNLVRQWLLK
jgi:Membrane bound beta barrel domain (DUF5777)